MIDRRQFNTGLLASVIGAMAMRASAKVPVATTPDHWALNRLTFGATPASLAALSAAGLPAWLDSELAKPETDDALQAKLDTARLSIAYEAGMTSEGATWEATDTKRPYAYLAADPAELLKFLDYHQGFNYSERIRPTHEVMAASLIRAVHADAQLREVVTQFWHEHFSVNALKDETTAIFMPAYDAMLRRHAFGNFREMLGEVARAPVMLWYLNNEASRASPANENYARELLELHTLGAEAYYNDLYDDWKAVPGAQEGAAAGYIDQDVYEVARAFTGWSVGDGRWIDDGVYAPETGRFLYIEAWHDPYQKRILGHEFKPNRGPMADGDTVLDMLAAHPATARFVTGKLVRRLGLEAASPEVLEQAATVFQDARDAPDQIAQVIRAIVLHPDFSATPPAKLRRPFEFLSAMYRASGAVVASPELDFNWWLERAAWTQHHVRPPTGHSDHSEDWASTNVLNGMVDLALHGHSNWFAATGFDAATAHGDARTWGTLAAGWVERFGCDPKIAALALEQTGAAWDDPVSSDPDYVAWVTRTTLTLAALTPEVLFR